MIHVHVMSPPDEGPIDANSRICDEPDRGELIVYHPLSVPDGSDWTCAGCGESSGPKEFLQ